MHAQGISCMIAGQITLMKITKTMSSTRVKCTQEMSTIDKSILPGPIKDFATADVSYRVAVDIIFNRVALLQLLLSNEVVKVY